MKYILWLWVIAWILYLIATSKPAIMAPCNTWVGDIYYKCPVQTAWEPDIADLPCDKYTWWEMWTVSQCEDILSTK